MKTVERPVPNRLQHRGKTFQWVNSFYYKSQAEERAKSIRKKGYSALITKITPPKGKPLTRYAVYTDAKHLALI